MTCLMTIEMQSDLDAAQAALSELTAAGKENSEEANELRAENELLQSILDDFNE